MSQQHHTQLVPLPLGGKRRVQVPNGQRITHVGFQTGEWPLPIHVSGQSEELTRWVRGFADFWEEEHDDEAPMNNFLTEDMQIRHVQADLTPTIQQ
jgi:hypothetical protein